MLKITPGNEGKESTNEEVYTDSKTAMPEVMVQYNEV